MATIRRRFHLSAQLYPAISKSSELARKSVVLGLQMRIPACAAEKTYDCCKPDPRELRTDHRKRGSVTHDRSPADLDRRSCRSTLCRLVQSHSQPAWAMSSRGLCIEEHIGCSYISVTLFLSFFFFLTGIPAGEDSPAICHNAALMTFSFKRTSLKHGASH